jgi:hypothetical protein
MRRGLSHLVCCFLLVACCKSSLSSERAAIDRFAEIRKNPLELTMFLRRMPKGGDLHNHLSGAIYAESYIRWAGEAGLCVVEGIWKFGPCTTDAGQIPVADIVKKPKAYGDHYAHLVNALSMRNYIPGQERASAHDQFFDSFDRFGGGGDGRTVDMVAEVTHRAAAQNINYLELMVSLSAGAARKIGEGVPWNNDIPAAYTKLMDAGLRALIPDTIKYIDKIESDRRRISDCDRPTPPPACAVTVRYVAQVIRTFPLPLVLAQTVLAFELARADSRVVGLNFVGYEDHLVALDDYKAHMQLVKELSRLMPGTHVSLHAGELAFGLVPPEHLLFHIREAVEVAGALRIGHGVDIAYEEDANRLLAKMAKDKIAVEINLTSNDVILGVRGNRHPFELYRRAGVPLVLSTDDEGVSRIDLTHEFQRAAETYGLSYKDLKEFARNSLTYSFLSGASLWADAKRASFVSDCAGAAPGGANEKKSAVCDLFLTGSDKARQQWRLEAEFVAFEKTIAAQRPGAAKN